MPAEMDFSNYLMTPVAPPKWVHDVWTSHFPHLGRFLVIGDMTPDFNCLGWAVQQVAYIDDGELYTDLWALQDFMDYHGYEVTQDASLADIDIWGIELTRPAYTQSGTVVGMESRWIVEHFSLKTSLGWSSKIGNGHLILHGRYALRDVPGTVHLDGHYGNVIAHFRRKRVVLMQQVQQQQEAQQAQQAQQAQEAQEAQETQET